MKLINIYINDLRTGKRLDQVVTEELAECSRSRVASKISMGEIVVCGQTKRPSYKVKSGDHITINLQPELVELKPEPININILFEDDHIIVIDKPHGLVVHPGPGNYSNTLVNALLYHVPTIADAGDSSLRPGIVHRLDKDTSGLILAAKTSAAFVFLQKEFKYRRIEKEYLALVLGGNIAKEGCLELPIGRHPVKRKMMGVNQLSGKIAKTFWRVKERFDQACLLEIILHTGRTHQIRVHFYAIGHPLIGDRIYTYRRFRRKNIMAPRQMLHSHRLVFRHPYSGFRMEFITKPPKDFINVINKLKNFKRSLDYV